MLKINYVDKEGKEKTITKVSHGIKDMKRTLNYSKSMVDLFENKEINILVDEEKELYLKTPQFYIEELELGSDYLLEIFSENGLTQEILDDELSMSHKALFDLINEVQRQIMGGEETEEKKQQETTL